MLPKRVLYYGKDEDLPAQTQLRAGPLALVYEQGDLRTIRLGSTEILRRIYVAVRDRNWGTVAPVLSNLTMQVERESFQIAFDVSNRQDEIDFVWQASIRGEADGTITFSMDGEACSTFWRNRIGFCVLHPANLSGHAGVVEHVDGGQEPAVFPLDFVADQPVRPFAELRAIAHEVTPGIWAEVRFAGDIFEMEDQRNWTDASYKTFCTPLRLPYPVKIEKGSRISQSVQIRLRQSQPGPGRVFAVAARVDDYPLLSIEREAQSLPVPLLGLGVASHGQLLTENELARLRVLNLHHLRVDVQPGAVDVREMLAQAAEQARALGIGLEVALRMPAMPEGALDSLRRMVAELRPPVRAWLCFPEAEHFAGGSPVRQAVETARAALESDHPDVPFCAGTNSDFIFLQRNPPPLEQIEQVTFAVCPQVHAFDNTSLVETLPVQGDAVRNARRLALGKPVMVSPVTLKMRFNPYATGPTPALEPGHLPSQVDARQMSLFGAGWTLGSFKYLAEAETASITYFETSGWRGVMEQAQGSPLPVAFRSLPGSVFPLYHILADVGEFAGGSLLPVTCTHPLKVTAACLRKGSAERILLANHTSETYSVRVAGLSRAYVCRVLDETNVLEAMQSPEQFRARPGRTIHPQDGECFLEIKPFATAALDRLGN